MKTGLSAFLEAVTRVRGVRGAMVVSSDEGLVVADASMEGVDGAAVAALAAGVVVRLSRAIEAAGRMRPAFVHLQAERGALIAVPAAGDLLVVAVADADVNVGLLRLELRRVAEQLA